MAKAEQAAFQAAVEQTTHSVAPISPASLVSHPASKPGKFVAYWEGGLESPPAGRIACRTKGHSPEAAFRAAVQQATHAVRRNFAAKPGKFVSNRAGTNATKPQSSGKSKEFIFNAHFPGGYMLEPYSAVLLGLIGFVIYPLLPDRFIDPWKLINPRESWITVIAIAAIGFANYVLLRLYGGRGLLYTAVLGGLVNSTATVAELSVWLRDPSPEIERAGISLNFVTLAAMFVRNLALLAVFAPKAVPVALLPIAVMSGGAIGLVWLNRSSAEPNHELKLSSPVSIRKLISFGTLFLAIEIAGTIGKRYLGHYGVLIVSLLGGLVSSASTTAAAALLAAHGETAPYIAGIATVVTSIASAASNLPVIYRVT
jgi:hypothetical protein